MSAAIPPPLCYSFSVQAFSKRFAAMKLSRRAVMLGNLSLLAEASISSVARMNLALASEESVLSAAVDTYIFGYPLAIMDMTRSPGCARGDAYGNAVVNELTTEVRSHQ
jgi:hypothetical protein